VNFNFSLRDVRNICRGLEDCGVEYIEIGHGIGLNAGASHYGPALHTDNEYIDAAKEVTQKAKIGMFCIPGIARVSDLGSAAERGLDFVRIGTMVTGVESSRPYIEKARALGMTVMANYMKSYASPPEKFAQKAKLSESYGAQCVYIVDSSGGMVSGQIGEYAKAIHAVSGIALGFHGHNNLGLAVANSLYAAQSGFEFVDVSLQGLGRSSGNAPTEQLVSVLKKMGMAPEIDLVKLMIVGYKFVFPLIENKGCVPLDTVSGYADFHSSYMNLIHKYSAKYEVDPIKLIIEVCKRSKVDADDIMVSEVASAMSKESVSAYNFTRYHGEEQL
jgi:4-hydroxy-2-oxovalerate aldolase